jgi:transposase InsO family protein
LKRQFRKQIKPIGSDNGGEYISHELKHFFITRGVFHELTPPYSLESNGIATHFNQIINMIARSMTIGAPDFPCQWAEAIKMGAYLMNTLPQNQVLSLTTLFKHFHCK